MNKNERYYKLVESYCESKFRGCDVKIELREHKQNNGFFFNEKHYYLCDTKIIYQWERPDCFKVAFNNEFLKELSKFVPVRGKKQLFRNWLFNVKFPTFEYKHLLQKKLSYYEL